MSDRHVRCKKRSCSYSHLSAPRAKWLARPQRRPNKSNPSNPIQRQQVESFFSFAANSHRHLVSRNTTSTSRAEKEEEDDEEEVRKDKSAPGPRNEVACSVRVVKAWEKRQGKETPHPAPPTASPIRARSPPIKPDATWLLLHLHVLRLLKTLGLPTSNS